jgi:hypothetical protein
MSIPGQSDRSICIKMKEMHRASFGWTLNEVINLFAVLFYGLRGVRKSICDHLRNEYSIRMG